MNVRSISAVTLAVSDMGRSVDFYQDMVGLDMLYGGSSASFSSFKIGDGYLNLVLELRATQIWRGRLIFHVAAVDALYERLIKLGKFALSYAILDPKFTKIREKARIPSDLGEISRF